MLDIKFIRENLELVQNAAKQKNCDIDLELLVQKDGELTKLKTELQELQTERNVHSKKIPKAQASERPALIAKGKEIGQQIDALKPNLKTLEEEVSGLLLLVPQIPSPEAPLGADENDNVEVKKWGEIKEYDFKLKDHVEILELQGWADFERVAEVCGSRSYSLRNEMLLLEMAMHRYALDKLMSKGFNLVSTPALCRESALIGTGHFPTGKDQVYYLPEDDLYLSGTAEVQVNSFHANEIIDESKLPILYAGYSPCFRREAGSYGRDVRGLIRVHQFMKVEQYVICKNDEEESKKWHKALLETSEEIMKEFELPYRIVECCTGDMGTGKVRMFDIEAWVPSEEKYRETHSCSSLHDWQSRRTNTRYREGSGDVKHCHTLNNTAVATPRLLVPFIEIHQQKDGTLNIPKALRPYMAGREVIGKSQ